MGTRKRRRSVLPLTPNRSVTCVEGDNRIQLAADEVTKEQLGLKAWGLLSIPAQWTVPFFVISGDSKPSKGALQAAAQSCGLDMRQKIMIRSSGVNEALQSRGSLDSASCEFSQLLPTLTQLQKAKRETTDHTVHWVVQLAIPVRFKGHLSNERRLCKDLRDWEVEIEPRTGQLHDKRRIPLRIWRDGKIPDFSDKLHCIYESTCTEQLKVVARWAYDRQLRLHCEWIWDGKNVFVVQADECRLPTGGEDPIKLVRIPKGTVADDNLEVFRKATSQDFKEYAKLSNVALYTRLGYSTVPFYVLDDGAELEKILKRTCSAKLKRDLRRLSIRPLVIRTNGRKEMLPRSDELRSAEEACTWLTGKFVDGITPEQLKEKGFALLAHNFVPATASAWCLAHPEVRRVRIEALWGIPEGLYWHAHDVFDVDTRIKTLRSNARMPSNIRVHERLRFKAVFMAPNASGDWVVHTTTVGPDWRRSIRQLNWVKQIAWDSRRIARVVGHSVIVMWLVDVPQSVSPHPVMPWYHQRWDASDSFIRAAPRKKRQSAAELVLRTREDWERLRSTTEANKQIARVIVDPYDAELIRSREFATELGALAKRRGFIVELSGGILSHAYYLLAATGCSVECADLYALDEETLEFNKLVRDGVPDTIQAQGETVDVTHLAGDALIEALKRKLIEEAFEVADASTTEHIVEELADGLEVIYTLATRLGIDLSRIEQIRTEKATRRGAFDKGIMLVRTALKPTVDPGSAEKIAPLEVNAPQMRSISRPEDLPEEHSDINVDRRHDESGKLDLQVTFTVPAHVRGVKPGTSTLRLEPPSGAKYSMRLEVAVAREGAKIRCELHLRNAPKQYRLPLPDDVEREKAKERINGPESTGAN